MLAACVVPSRFPVGRVAFSSRGLCLGGVNAVLGRAPVFVWWAQGCEGCEFVEKLSKAVCLSPVPAGVKLIAVSKGDRGGCHDVSED